MIGVNLSHKQIIVVVVAVADVYDYGDYDDYYDDAAATSSSVLMVIDVSRLMSLQIAGHVLSLIVPHCGLL